MTGGILRATLLAVLLATTACDSVEDRVRQHAERGESFLEQGDTARARVEFANALRLDGRNVPANLGMAQVHERAGDFKAMAVHLSIAIDADPRQQEARLSMARLMYLSKRLDLALEHVNAAIEIDPTNPEALAARANINVDLGDLEAARADVAAALAVEPAHPGAAAVKVLDTLKTSGRIAALDTLQPFLDARPDNETLNFIKLALLEDGGAPADVSAHLETMVQRFPENGDLRMALASIYAQNGQLDEAEQVFRAYANDVDPSVQTRLRFVAFLEALRGTEVAEAELTRLAEDPNDGAVYLLALAERDRRAGRLDAARSRLQSTSTADLPLKERLAVNLKIAELDLAAGQTAEAESRIAEILKEDPSNVDALMFRAEIDLDAGNPDAALRNLNLALSESSGNPRIFTGIAMAHQLLGNATLAGENFAAAMQAANFAEAETMRYAGFLEAALRTADAQQILSEAVKRHPENRRMLSKLASLRLTLGDWAGVEQVAAQLERAEAGSALAGEFRAAALSGQERFDESLIVLEKMSETADLGLSAMTALVRSYLRAGKEVEAKAFLERTLDQNPTNFGALALRAGLAERSGELVAAEADLKALRDAYPRDARAHELLTDFYLRTDNRAAWTDAIETGLATNPGFTGLRMRQAAVQERDGDFAAAIATYQDMIAQDTGGIVAVNNMVSLVSDHFAENPEKLAAARAVAPILGTTAIPEFQDTYGWLLYLDGSHEDALRALKPAAEALPDNPWVRYHLGMAYHALDQKDLAIENLEAAISLAADGDFPPAEQIADLLSSLRG